MQHHGPGSRPSAYGPASSLGPQARARGTLHGNMAQGGTLHRSIKSSTHGGTRDSDGNQPKLEGGGLPNKVPTGVPKSPNKVPNGVPRKMNFRKENLPPGWQAKRGKNVGIRLFTGTIHWWAVRQSGRP